MKTLKTILEEFDEHFPTEMITYQDNMVRIETRAVTVENLKRFITQSVKDALEACRNKKRRPWRDDHDQGLKVWDKPEIEGWNANTTQYDENVKKFMVEEEI